MLKKSVLQCYWHRIQWKNVLLFATDLPSWSMENLNASEGKYRSISNWTRKRSKFIYSRQKEIFFCWKMRGFLISCYFVPIRTWTKISFCLNELGPFPSSYIDWPVLICVILFKLHILTEALRQLMMRTFHPSTSLNSVSSSRIGARTIILFWMSGVDKPLYKESKL